MLHSEPSFSVYADEDGLLDSEKGDLKASRSSGEFSFARTMGLIVENDEDDRLSGFEKLGVGEKEEQIEPVSPKLYLGKQTSFDESDDDEEYYKSMVDEDPSNPLFLRNYARFLQSNGDLNGAEEYYLRAAVADPRDGEILMQYAMLVSELHHDQDRALSYFESAARAAPEDTNILAAYARFLWEISEDGATALEESLQAEERPVKPPPPPHLATGLGVDVGLNSSTDPEECYERMINENPCDPLLLGNYAQFLQQTKGDLEGAEEYYSRAIQADPREGKVISQYAQLTWELHHDQDKASSYFERAVEAAPTDSHVLAAYAKFLWEAEDEDDELRMTVLQEPVISAQL